MLWVILAIAAAAAFAAANIIDKFVMSHEMKDARLAVVTYGIMGFALFVGASLIFGGEQLTGGLKLFSVLTGVCYCSGILCYYYAISREEVSKAVPVFSTIPLFILLLAYFLLDERLTLIKYAGVLAIVAGAVLISIKINGSKFSFKKSFWILLLGAFFFAAGDVAIKYVTNSVSIWSMMLWTGFAVGAFALATFMLHHPHIRQKAKRGMKHLFASNGVTVVGDFLFFIAISLASASLVSALAKVQSLFVFAAATVLSIYMPKFMKEKVTFGILVRKICAIVLIIAGAVLIAT